MKILCLESTLEACSEAMHPSHLIQCYNEILSTLLFLEGINGGYVKANANTMAWEGFSGALFRYKTCIETQLSKLRLKPSKPSYKKVYRLLREYSNKGTSEGTPDWLGTPETLRVHRGWVIYKSEKNPGLKEFYDRLYSGYKVVTKIK